MSKFLTLETSHIEIRGDYYYHEENSGEIHKLDIGAELNRLEALADRIFKNADATPDSEEQKDVSTIASIVSRVADFEELQRE